MFEFEIVDVITRVKWQPKLKFRPMKHEKLDANFQLDHLDRNLSCFKVTCTYNRIEDFTVTNDSHHVGSAYRMDLSLKQMESEVKSKRRKLNSSQVDDFFTDDCKRPSSVWASFNNNGENKLLKAISHSEFVDEQPRILAEWSEQFFVEFNSDYSGYFSPTYSDTIDTISLTCVFWMKIDNTDHGEMNVVKHLKNLYVQQSNCDVQFCFKGGPKIGGHVSILAARSPVFAAMFQHDMRESKTREVVIQDIQPEVFNDLLHFIYSGRTQAPLNENTAQLMFMAADKYNVEDLKEDCVSFLLSQMQTTNALDLMVWAHLHSIEKIKDAALNFVAANGQVIFKSNEWEEIITAHPDLCLLVTRCIQYIKNYAV